ncbi:MAG TPA: DUF169 domain-containing protein [Thermoleophilia bacterium]|nr:DUF169 domain-containing protein [Thermoleophilia bacterium]
MPAVQPDPTVILEKLAIKQPLIGLYDAPDAAPFAPLVEPGEPHECVFVSYPRWAEGKTLHITRAKHGCGAPHLLGVQERSREEMVKFLADEEGLRATHELMEEWLDAVPGYTPRYEHILIGPLRADQYEYLRTVTFYVNPDQLAVLVTGASYYSRPDDPPVMAPFGSGCSQLVAAIGDLDAPRAIVGATDQAMRKHLDPGLLAFTVTRPMFERLCQWADDPGSSLHNAFLAETIAARGGSL